MKETRLKELLQEHIIEYLNNIAHELEESHDKWFDGFGFPLFAVTSKDYHEQVYFESYLESYTRKMINVVLRELIEEETGIDSEWPELDCVGLFNGYTNKECEEKFNFEFIDREQKIGYRYTSIDSDKIEALLKAGNVDKITIIVWEEESYFTSDDPRVKVISLIDFFNEMFCDLCVEEIQKMYDVFVDNITDAVKKANSLISLVTIPGFTPAYIHKSRNEVTRNLEEEIKKLSSFYVRNESFKATEENSKKLIGEFNLAQYFLSKGWSKAFVGTSQYAKSFLTSEYLYKYFGDNPLFDYTPIVSGYLKSIEQLMDVLCVTYRNQKGFYENMRNYTLGNYIYFLDNHEEMLRESIREDKSIIIACLNSYLKENRNKLFHKDYFNNWDRVKRIRTNTIFLYVVLMGGVVSEILTPRVLGILDDRYDRLFYALDKQDNRHFSILLDGVEYSDMIKQPRTEGISFDRNGLVTTSIKFMKFDYDHYVRIEISRKKLPTEIWSMDNHGMKKLLL